MEETPDCEGRSVAEMAAAHQRNRGPVGARLGLAEGQQPGADAQAGDPVSQRVAGLGVGAPLRLLAAAGLVWR